MKSKFQYFLTIVCVGSAGYHAGVLPDEVGWSIGLLVAVIVMDLYHWEKE